MAKKIVDVHNAGIYRDSQATQQSTCQLTDGDFKKAFQNLGVYDLTAASKKREAFEKSSKRGKVARKRGASRDEEMKDVDEEDGSNELRGWSDASRPPALQQLQQVLSLLNTAARLQVRSRHLN